MTFIGLERPFNKRSTRCEKKRNDESKNDHQSSGRTHDPRILLLLLCLYTYIMPILSLRCMLNTLMCHIFFCRRLCIPYINSLIPSHHVHFSNSYFPVVLLLWSPVFNTLLQIQILVFHFVPYPSVLSMLAVNL